MTPDHKLTYRISTVTKKLEISRATVYRLVKDGRLRLVKISRGASGITAESLEQHMRSIGAA